MPATEETRYDIKRLHRAFAVSSIGLLIATIWMFAADHHRQWKSIQRTSDRIEMRMAQWRKVQVLTEDVLSERAALQHALSETCAIELPPGLLEDFREEMRADARRREVEEPDVGKLAALVDQLKKATDAAAQASKAWRQAELDADRAKLDADDAAQRAGVEDGGARKQQARDLKAASDQATTSVAKALDRKLAAEAAVVPARRRTISWLHDKVQAARFREDKRARRRKSDVARLDVAKARLGAGVREDKSAVELGRLQTAIDRLKQRVHEETMEFEAAAAHRKRLLEIVRAMTAREDAIQKRLDATLAESRRLDKLLVEKRSTYFNFRGILPVPGKKWLELPFLDAFNSPRKIENVWSEGLDQPLGSFGRVRRFDRCTTCHQGIQETLPEGSGQGAFSEERIIDFALELPDRLPADTGGGQGGRAVPEEMAHRLFGIRLAADGLLREHDVTVKFIQPKSLATGVRRSAARGRMVRAGDLRDHVFQLPNDAACADVARPGLMLGDVIVAIDGAPVPRDEHGRQWVLDKLIDAAAARRARSESETQYGDGPVRPLRLTVRRGLPSPFASHPRLDLFVGSTSPHKKSEFGCTVCHEGQGSATDFKWASHTPNDLKMRRIWKEKYGWFDNRHWEFPMYPRRFVESSCLKCHHDVLELETSERYLDPPASKLAKGYRLIRTFGCFGCHEINGFDGPDKRVGPDLRVEPNYYAAALQFKGAGGTGYEQLTAVEKTWIETLIVDPDNREVRRRVHSMLDEDSRKAAARTDKATLAAVGRGATPGGQSGDAPRFSDYVHRTLAPLFKDHDVPGNLRKVGPSLRFVRAKLDPAFLFDWIQKPSRFRPSTRMPQAFGLWGHLPARRLRMERATLQGELDRLGSDPEGNDALRRRALDQALATLAQPLRDVGSIEKRLEPIAVYSMVQYLRERSQAYRYAEPPDGITPVKSDDERRARIRRGKVAFEQSGCLVCHDHVDFPDIKRFRDTDFVVNGPDLSDMAAKFAVDRNPDGRKWLYSWIQQPSRYNVRTTMPNSLLSPVEHRSETGEVISVTDPVADIVAYLMAAADGGWEPAKETVVELNAAQNEDLKELTRIHLRDVLPEAVAERFMEQGIPWDEQHLVQGAERELIVTSAEAERLTEAMMTRKRIFYVAKRSLLRNGCFACHDIPGLEDARPIGPGLSDWGRKKTSLLAFHSVAKYVERYGPAAESEVDDVTAADSSGTPMENARPVEDERALYGYYADQLEAGNRIGFIFQKLTAPRSFDYRETGNKKYTERLQMPQFPLTVAQREAVMTFVLGLVSDPPSSKYVYRPDARTKALLEGHEVLVKYSCHGCHVMEPEKWELSFPADYYGPRDRQTAFPFVATRFPPERRAASRAVDRRGMRSAELEGMPALGGDGKPTILDDEGFPIEEEEDEEFNSERLIHSFDLWKPALLDGAPYQVGEGAIDVPADQIARRVRSYGGALTKYLLPIVVDREKAVNPNAKGAEAWAWLAPLLIGEGDKVQPGWLHDYLLDPYPIRPAALMRMPRFNLSSSEATRLVNYFAAKDNARYPYEFLRQRRGTYLANADARYAARLEELNRNGEMQLDGPADGRRLLDAMRIVTNGNYCVRCHRIGDFNPAGIDRVKAPDLAVVHRRLRTDYVRKWVARPASIQPYAPMPVNIPYAPDAPFLGSTVPQALYHGNSVEQLDALVDLLMNYDQYAMRRSKVAPIVK